MAKKFNIDSYKSEIKSQIRELIKELNETSSHNYLKVDKLETAIENLKKRLNPQYMCEYCYSDRHAYEVLELVNEKKMIVRRLKAESTYVGMSDAQSYEFSSNLTAPEVTLRLHKDGRWYEAGNCNPFGITKKPHEYFDFSF